MSPSFGWVSMMQGQMLKVSPLTSVCVLLAFECLLRSFKGHYLWVHPGRERDTGLQPSRWNWLHNVCITSLSFFSPKNSKDEFMDNWVTSLKGLLISFIGDFVLNTSYTMFFLLPKHSNMNDEYFTQVCLAIIPTHTSFMYKLHMWIIQHTLISVEPDKSFEIWVL